MLKIDNYEMYVTQRYNDSLSEEQIKMNMSFSCDSMGKRIILCNNIEYIKDHLDNVCTEIKNELMIDYANNMLILFRLVPTSEVIPTTPMNIIATILELLSALILNLQLVDTAKNTLLFSLSNEK